MLLQTITIISGILNTDQLPKPDSSKSIIPTIMSVVFGLTGSICLLVITIAGFRYVVSHGDPQAITQAKDAIIYAIIGLIVSLVAFSIVAFVVGGVG